MPADSAPRLARPRALYTSKELQSRGSQWGWGVAFPLYSPRPRRRGLGARTVVAAAAAERFASGRSALAAPRGHGPVRALLPLSLKPGSTPRPRLHWFHWLRARQQPRPRAPARAMERLRGARGRLPRGGLRAPPGLRAEGAFPGAGRGRRRALGYGALRWARPDGAALVWLPDWSPETARGCTGPRGVPGSTLRSGLPGPLRFVP